MTAGWLRSDAGSGPDVDVLLDVAAEAFGVTVDDLLGRRVTKDIARYRHITVAAIRQVTAMSYPDLGDVFERDHSTMINSCQRVDREYRVARDRLVSAMRAVGQVAS